MNRYYIIVPVVLMAVFVYFERGASKENIIKEQKIEETKKVEEAKKDAEKKDLEEKAKLDSERRNAQRIKEETERAEKKKAEYEAKLQKSRDDIKSFTDHITQNTQKVNSMEKELAEKRDFRERENRAVFELAKKVEITKKMRRNAELQVQRYTEMVTTRLADSSLAKLPPDPADEKK